MGEFTRRCSMGFGTRLGAGKQFHFGLKGLGYPNMPPTVHRDIEGGVIRVRMMEEACGFVGNNS